MFKRQKRGFTIIEVSLFLALSGFLMVGLIASANSSISRQRYNDSVNDVAEFVRGIYAEAINTSINANAFGFGSGRSEKAVYGKLVDFNKDRTGSVSKIDVYTIVGDAVDSNHLPTEGILNALQTPSSPANSENRLSANIKTGAQFYEKQTHNLPWDTSLENSDGTWIKGMLLILRSPTSGTVYTYYYADNIAAVPNPLNDFNKVLQRATNSVVNICIDSPDNNYGRRRNLRIRQNASGSSGVELIAQDNIYSASNPEGSQCDGHAGNTPTS